MNNSSYLHSLIHSLSMSEKRYFKVYAANNTLKENNNYLRLFDIIAGEQEYNKEKIDSLISREPFAKTIRVTKHYLYKLILKSLRAYYDEKSVDSSIRSLLEEADILYAKGLTELTLESLKKAYSLATQYERYSIILDIERFQMLIYSTNKDTEALTKSVNAIDKREYIIQKLSKINQYITLSNELTLANHFISIEKAQLAQKRIASFLKNKLLTEKPDKDSFYINYSWHYLKAHTPSKKIPVSTRLKHIKAQIELFNKHKHRIKDTPMAYISTMHNYSIYLFQSNQIDLCIKVMNSIEDLLIKNNVNLNTYQSTQFNVLSNSLKLKFLISSGKTSQLEKVIENTLQILNNDLAKLNKFSYFLLIFLIGYAYFLLEKYDPALEQFNIIKNAKDISEIELVKSSVQIISLITHYELGNVQLLEYITKHSKRFLKRKDRLYLAEQILIKTLEKIAKAESKKTEIELFKRLRNNPDLTHGEIKRYFDIDAWIESKISGKDFATTIAKKY